ncbi:MAG: LytTR family DNA-binding domain-containing protein [Bacteroidota bacterium]
MMKCLIVDDEEMAIKVIESHIGHIEGLEITGRFYNAMDAFSALQKQHIDLLFLDIQMPKMSGLSLLQSLPVKPHVILTTAHREFALEGYEFDVVDYLLKPIAFDRFLRAVGKVFRMERPAQASVIAAPAPAPTEPPFFYIKSDRQFVKILLDDILYIESLRNHIKILTTEGDHITLQGISQIEEKLPPQRFLRTHRSFIISLSKVQRFSHTQVTVGETQLPIGSRYRGELLRRLETDLM